jgi:HlyD family secretion protein
MPATDAPKSQWVRNLSRRPGVWILVVILLAAGVVGLARARGPRVRTVRVERRDLEQHLVASGRVRVPTRVEMAAQLSGLVVAVGATEGQRVAKGDLLVQLDDARNAAEAQQIAAAPLGADSRVGLTAQLQAQAQLTGARAQLSQTRIVAPHSGTVLRRDVEPGDVVQPSRMLLELAADSDVELVFDPDERNLAWLSLGQPARVAADAYPRQPFDAVYPRQPFDAVVSYLAPSVDPQRGSIEVRLQVPRPPPFLKPDMTVSIDLTIAAKQGVLTVPADTVRGAANPWVQVVEGGRVARRKVELGIRGEGSVEIAAGLDERSQVIVPAGRQLAAGARVRTEQ